MAKIYNNQKLLKFLPAPKDALHPYSLWNNDALQDALSNLSVTAFKVYIYLGIYKEMKDLQEKGYLIPDPDTKDNANTYIFLEAKM